MKSLFVMDPFDKLMVAGDSTYALMKQCCLDGEEVWACEPRHLSIRDAVAYGKIRPVHVDEQAPYFHPGPVGDVRLEEFDVVWMRKDPPFDMNYILCTYVLDTLEGRSLVVNDPIGLKLFNEKLAAMQFPDLHPSTLLSSDQEELKAFVKGQADGAVLKPWDGNGGRGILVTDGQDRNLTSMIEILTSNGQQHILAQAYLPGIARGDKRVLLFDGEVAGAMLRIPSSEDHRGNMHVGATVQACELSTRDQEICETLGDWLKQWGQIFVGIDIIDGYLTEINVTSPTGICEINELYGRRLETELLDCVRRKLSEAL